jgi:hypothetical protein
MNVFFFFISICFSQISFSQFDGNTTPTYPELITYYKNKAQEHKEIELYAMGTSDYGLPIYVCIINGAQDSIQTFKKAKEKTTILINNAIHPGEPDGVNACILWLEEWIKGGKQCENIPVVAIIPAYNVGGMMNRSSRSRANQDGPEEYGFRGNAQNLDLNRDFIKMDSKNMFTFASIYQALNPDVFIDTHVSNGADYQYVLTLITSMKERSAPSISNLTIQSLVPAMEKQLMKKNITLFPYVELMEETPDKGIMAFNDLPRYSMGYASLFHSISFTTETHMLKPFPQRVKATKEFIIEILKWTSENNVQVEKARVEAIAWQRNQKHFKCNYELTEKKDSILFLGFEHSYKKSEVTGFDRLFYDRKKPYERLIPRFQTYTTQDSVRIPKFYIVRHEAFEVIERLNANGVEMKVVDKDTVVKGVDLIIGMYKSTPKPYEGHFLHSQVECFEKENLVIPLKKGDVIVSTDQDRRSFMIAVLEPRAEDSYFSWNYFDSYLQQKEHFSAYVFEEKAKEVLESNLTLKKAFEEKKKNDEIFRMDAKAQLNFIYKNSDYFEQSFNRLPVSKVY